MALLRAPISCENGIAFREFYSTATEDINPQLSQQHLEAVNSRTANTGKAKQRTTAAESRPEQKKFFGRSLTFEGLFYSIGRGQNPETPPHVPGPSFVRGTRPVSLLEAGLHWYR